MLRQFARAIFSLGLNFFFCPCNLQRICSYVLMPLAFTMGVEWEDSFVVAELLGVKTFLNEFIAYSELSKYIKNRRQNLGGTTLKVGHLFFPVQYLFTLNCIWNKIFVIFFVVSCEKALEARRTPFTIF